MCPQPDLQAKPDNGSASNRCEGSHHTVEDKSFHGASHTKASSQSNDINVEIIAEFPALPSSVLLHTNSAPMGAIIRRTIDVVKTILWGLFLLLIEILPDFFTLFHYTDQVYSD
jgi:hypothetical protein